jgi:peptide/nickel transport system permease protein
MRRFLWRRILQTIPTVFGVVLITFVLFNIVGGSPAGLILGKNVTPKALEEFDEQRGFNKPVLFGSWTKTRALTDTDFRNGPGPFKNVPGAVWSNGVLSLSPGKYALPLAFALKPSNDWKLTIEGRTISDHFSSDWNKSEQIFQASDKVPEIEVTDGTLELRSVQLRRKTAHFFDSQFVFYLRQLAHLDFGISSSLNQPVSRLLKAGILPSLALTVPIFVIELVLSLVLALVCAFFRNRFPDRLLVFLSVALMSINYLVWIVAGQYWLAYKWGWFPVWGFESWRYLMLPVLIGVISGLGVNVRFYRTIMLDEMYRDYVRTAFAKGVSRSGVLFKHVLKNAMIPVVTNVVIAIPFLYTGSLLLESFFGIPGLGYLGVNAINSSDVDVVRAIVLIGSLLFVVTNLITDLLYARLDPRVRLE